MNAWTEASSLTSSRPANAFPPSLLILAARSPVSRRAPSATGWPAAASAWAVAAPMPDDAPATNAGRRAGCGSNRGTSARLRSHRQAREAADADRMDPLRRRLVDLVALHPCHELAERDRRLQPGQVRAQAVVPTGAEADQRRCVAVQVVAVGVGEGARVAIGRADQQKDAVVGTNHLAVRLEIGGQGSRDELARRVVPHRFFDPIGNPLWVTERLSEFGGIA